MGGEAANGAGQVWRPPGPAKAQVGESDEILRTLHDFAAQHRKAEGSEKEIPGGKPLRWGDIRRAMSSAIGEDGVEMGIIRAAEVKSAWTFQMKTVEGWPVHCTITRVEDPDRLYEIETKVGRFPDDPHMEERASALEAAFAKWMKHFAQRDAGVDE